MRTNNCIIKTFTSSIFKLLIAMLVFSACSSGKDPEKYMGYWVEGNSDLTIPTEIKKQAGKLFIIADNDGEKIEMPATFDEDGKSLNAKHLTPAGSLDMQVVYLEDSKRLKITMANSSTEFTKISETEAKERTKKVEAFYDPDFLIGKWINLKATDLDPIEIRKDGNKSELSKINLRTKNKGFSGLKSNPNASY
ncbi:hypothetical protein [Olivibacter jilunii]|uniref:hypothetical protein n=1 Tax=Olivibacter jilunii TaxID=985016 RepID=UPI0010325B65|nr:hypothetical protein [Olivibacter jilunii]